MVFWKYVSTTVTVPSRGWHKGVCQINSSWNKRAEAVVPDLEITSLKFYEALWHNKKFKAGWISTLLLYLLGYACDKTVTPAAVPRHSHCLFRRLRKSTSFTLCDWLATQIWHCWEAGGDSIFQRELNLEEVQSRNSLHSFPACYVGSREHFLYHFNYTVWFYF